MDLIEQIGPFVGLAALVGLAVLAFVIFQQSRDIRRLREWAGRAPERAREAADASLAAAEARGELTAEETPGRLARMRAAIAGFVRPRYEAVDRNMPIDGRIVLGVLGAGIIAAGVLTSGFGLVGDDEPRRGKRGQQAQNGQGDQNNQGNRNREGDRPEVAVLNATQTTVNGIPVQGLSGLADKVTNEVVRQVGYEVGVRGNSPTGFAESVVMYEPDARAPAAEFARAITPQLGETPTEEMAEDIRSVAGGAPVVLVVGLDDQDF